MPILTKSQLEALNQSSFPDNTSGSITPLILRTYNTATIDTLVDSLDTGSFATDISSLNAFTSSQLVVNANLNASSASQQISIDALNAFTQSYTPTNLGPLNAFTASQELTNTQLLNASSSFSEKFATIGTQSGSWGGGTINTGSFATTGSNVFVGNQTISGSTDKNGIFFKTGSSEFFVGQNSDSNLVVSSSANSKIIEINKSSGWVEYYAQANFNSGLNSRGPLDVRNVNQEIGSGYVARFDNFTASLQEGYAWVGKSGGSSVSVPTASFAGAVPVGTATTGSNTFNGNQNIIGQLTASALRVENNTHLDGQLRVTNDAQFDTHITIQGDIPSLKLRDTSGGGFSSGYDLRVNTGSFEIYDDTHNRDVLSDFFNPSTNKHTTSLTSEITIISGSDSVTIQGPFTASLQEGYVWVGDSTGKTKTVPTSSFSGGGVGFATTGSNTFTGLQTITGDGINVYNQNAAINLRANAQGSGSQYPGVNLTVAPNVYPGNVFGGYTILTEEGALVGATFLGMVANAYTPQYGPTTVPMIVANGNNPGGNDTAIIFAPNGTAEHYKKSDFKYGVDVTGSLSVSGSINTSVIPLAITSNTASLNASTGNTFQLNLVSGSATRLEISGTKSGQTINLLVSQSATGPGTLVFGDGIEQPSGSFYSASQVASGEDILTMATFINANRIYVANVKNFI